MSRTDVLLIYPQLGDWDDVVRDIPLSIIYPATDAVKRGFTVRAVDLRFYGRDWPRAIEPILRQGCSLVGVSVMTGTPIVNSLEITRYVKERYPAIPTVWGGPHPTTLPEQTLEHPDIDFVIRDAGSLALAQLVEHLNGGTVRKEEILGLGYKEGGRIRLSPEQTGFEILDYRDIPYDLVDISGSRYNRLNVGELVFPIFMSVGCPYQCTFCVTPAMSKKIAGKKWVALSTDSVLDHIEYLAQHYDFKRLQVYDDESFIDLDIMREILTKYMQRGFHRRFKLDFRGIRFNDLDRMGDDYLQLMADAGTEYMFVGLESGSPRILKIMKKNIRVEQVLRVNRRLARFPSLKPHYNFFCGIPGETYESLLETKDVLLQLVREHPRCYLGHGGHWKPIPGTEITTVAVQQYGLKLPSSLEGWAAIDTLEFDEKAPDYPWYNPRMVGMIRLVTLAGLILDGKMTDLIGNLTPVLARAASFLVRLYRPLLRLRLRFNCSSLLVEMKLYALFVRKLGRLLNAKHERLRESEPIRHAIPGAGADEGLPEAAPAVSGGGRGGVRAT